MKRIICWTLFLLLAAPVMFMVAVGICMSPLIMDHIDEHADSRPSTPAHEPMDKQPLTPEEEASIQSAIDSGYLTIRREGLEVLVSPLIWSMADYETKRGLVVTLIHHTHTYPTLRDQMSGRVLAESGPVSGIKILP